MAHAFGLKPDTEYTHLDHFRDGSPLWENHGWCLRLHGDGHEYMLWVAFYIIRAGTSERFIVRDVRIDQAIVVAVDGQVGGQDFGMHDNRFSVDGVHWSEYMAPEDLAVTRGDGDVVWATQRRRHVNTAQGWKIEGAAGGLELDLELAPWCEPFAFDGFDLILGSEALAQVRGTISHDGRVIYVEGFGQHEKVHTAAPIQRVDKAGWATLSSDLLHMWHVGAGKRVAFSCLANQPGEAADRINGHVVIDSESVRFTRGELDVKETNHWVDPMCGVHVATGWSICASTAAGTLQLDVSGSSRAYYIWDYLRGSTSLLYWQLAAGRATWTPLDGGGVIEEEIRYVAHTNRPFLRWG